MSKLLAKIRKNSTIKETALLSESDFINRVDETTTSIPAINIALSGTLDGGLRSGILTIAGPSRHFKTMYSLYMASAYLKNIQILFCCFWIVSLVVHLNTLNLLVLIQPE